MIKKIISGGREGVEQAALDVAIKLDIPHGGWVPRGCGNAFPKKYRLREAADAKEDAGLSKNIQSSGGTLYMFHSDDGRSRDRCRRLAQKFQKPFRAVDFQSASKFDSALAVCRWMVDHEIGVIHVSGDIAPKGEPAYTDAVDILESVVYLGHIEYESPLRVDFPLTETRMPETLGQAVDLLAGELTLKECVIIANMGLGELGALNATLGKTVSDNFGLWRQNTRLLQSCREMAKDDSLEIENVSMVIIQTLWERLKRTHRLRIVT